jgi:diguanylate cyclase (GGDEF)-like protein
MPETAQRQVIERAGDRVLSEAHACISPDAAHDSLPDAERPPIALAFALDRIDFGIMLLDRDMHATYMNRRFREIWAIPLVLARRYPTFHELTEHAEVTFWRHVSPRERRAYLDEREQMIRNGNVLPTQVDLPDGRSLRFCCEVLSDGGRVLTYADITDALRNGADAAMEQITAELRFTNETLESQGAYLVALAESTEESAQRAETARLMLEREIEERRKLEEQLREVATIDGLTRVLNRSAFLAAGEHELDRLRRTGRPLAVIMLDADHFKTINDRFGHAAGDATLKAVVKGCQSIVRVRDIVGRLGGEEFAIVLPGASLSAARRIAERLRDEIARTTIWFGDSPIRVTVSLGVAVAGAADQSIEQVLVRADTAMYRAKADGRNRVDVEEAGAR